MEREKQIEEIAKVLNECCNEYDKNGNHLKNKCANCEYWCDTNYMCVSYNIKEATALYNAGYRKERQGEWISVEDRLPQNDYQKSEKERKKYLVYTEPRGIMYEATFGYEEHDWWVTKESVFDRVLSLDFSEYVTHWMPLPTPPKMKGAEQ